MIHHILRSWTRPHWQWTTAPPHTLHWLGFPAWGSVLKVVFHSLASLFVCILYVFHWYFVPGVCVSLAHICALYPPVRKLHAEGNIFHWSSQTCSRIRRLFVWLVRCHHAWKILITALFQTFSTWQKPKTANRTPKELQEEDQLWPSPSESSEEKNNITKNCETFPLMILKGNPPRKISPEKHWCSSA